ncbi:MAG TPA: sigma-70 family RNA polymerase sigma factor [Paraburkholderia sp.]
MTDNTIPALRDFLVQRYDELRKRLTKKLGSPEAANDALQDTWLRLESREEQPGGIGSVQNFGAYLLRMAVNIAIDHQRRDSRLLSASEIDTLLDYSDPLPGPAETVEARSELNALIEVIRKMPLRRQQIFLMIRLERLAQQEVADRLGLGLRTVEKELKLAHDYCAARTGRSAEPRGKKIK